MNKEETYNWIEKYLAQQLTAKELKDFEERLSSDDAFRAEVELHRDLMGTLQGSAKHDFRAALKKVDQEWKKTASPSVAKIKTFDFRKWGAIAATLALLATAYFLLWPAQKSEQQLFAEHFDLYPMVLNQRSGSGTDSLLNEAIAAYGKRDFSKATQAFQNLQQADPNSVLYPFYEGLALLASQKANEAIPILESIANGADPKYTEQGRWYLALAYLQIGNRAKAQTVLEQIKTGQYQYANARRLLEQF